MKQVEIGRKSNTVAVIPALNEAETIGKIIQNLKQKMDVVVVDDGSTDAAAEASQKAGPMSQKKQKQKAMRQP